MLTRLIQYLYSFAVKDHIVNQDYISIPVSLPIREVVSKMSSGGAHRLPVGENPHILPNHLIVAKGWPAMNLTFSLEVFKGSTLTSELEQGLPSYGIVECDRFRTVFLLQKIGSQKVPRKLRPSPIVVAYSIGELVVNIPTKLRLDRSIGCTMGFLCLRHKLVNHRSSTHILR